MIWRDTIFLLGVPVDRVTMGEALGRLFAMLQAGGEDQRPRLATTVNADILAGALSLWRTEPKHPEFLNLLRGADLVLSDSAPLNLLSRLLGIPLPARVMALDLVPSAARELARRGRRVFLLCGRRETAEQAAAVMKGWFPSLQVSGCEGFAQISPAASLTEGPGQTLAERINGSGAEVLFVGLDNPQQRLQFYRMHAWLTVPLTIGVGSALAEVAAGRRRAPAWVRRLNLEWFHDLAVAPVRQWRRYLRDGWKLLLLSLPLLAVFAVLGLWHWRHRLAAAATAAGTAHPVRRFRSIIRTVAAVELPVVFDLTAVERLGVRILERVGEAHAVAVDLRRVRHMDAAGIGFLTSLQWDCGLRQAEFVMFGLHPGARRVLKADRAWDLFGPVRVPDLRAVAERLVSRWGAPFCCTCLEETGTALFVRLLGSLHRHLEHVLEEVARETAARPRDVVLDWEGCSAADADGLAACLRLAADLQSRGRLLVFARVPAAQEQALRRAATRELILLFAQDPEAARRLLEPSRRRPGGKPKTEDLLPRV